MRATTAVFRQWLSVQIGKSTVRNTAWLFLERLLRMSLSIGVMAWTARYLGAEGFGIYMYVIAFVALFSELTTLGLSGIVVKHLVSDQDKDGTEGKVLGTSFLLRLFAGILCLALSVVVIGRVEPNEPVLRILVSLLAFGNVFRAFEVVDLYFQARVASRLPVLVRSSALLLSSAAFVGLILFEGNVLGFIMVKMLESILVATGLVVVYRLTKKVSTWRFELPRARQLLKQSWPLILSGFSAIIYLKIDQVMLGKMVDVSAVGIYAVAAQLSEVWYFIPVAISSSLFPSLLNSKKKDQHEYLDKLQKLYSFLLWLAVGVAILVTVSASPVITLLYGSNYLEAADVLTVHIWSGLFIFMRAALSKWFIIEDLLIFSLVTHSLGAIINILANLLLIPASGMMGAAIATLISYATASYLALFLHPKTLVAARMMTLAVLFPLKYLKGFAKL